MKDVSMQDIATALGIVAGVVGLALAYITERRARAVAHVVTDFAELDADPDPPVTEGNDSTIPPVPVIADPVTIKYEDFALLVYEGDARLETFFVRDENRRLFRGGQVFRVVE